MKNESSPEDSAAAHAAGGVLPPAGGLMKGVDDAPADASARQARLFWKSDGFFDGVLRRVLREPVQAAA